MISSYIKAVEVFFVAIDEVKDFLTKSSFAMQKSEADFKRQGTIIVCHLDQVASNHSAISDFIQEFIINIFPVKVLHV
jgi:hypothetical protein